LKINSGSCEYTAAQFRHDAEKFALTLSDSVSNEHAHSLKGHLIIDGILSRIFFKFKIGIFFLI
jgi:hypothetical protein